MKIGDRVQVNNPLDTTYHGERGTIVRLGVLDGKSLGIRRFAEVEFNVKEPGNVVAVFHHYFLTQLVLVSPLEQLAEEAE